MKTSVERYSYLVVVLLVAVQLSVHLFYLTKGVEYLTTVLTHDDTYYYLETVWNHRTLGFPTFDGSHNTNGFHFLWYILLLAVSYLLPYKQLLLPVSMTLCAIFNALSYFFFIGLGKRTGSALHSIIMSSLWFASNIILIRNINGMENSLHSLVSWWVLYETFLFFDSLRRNQNPKLLRLTLALIANAFTRVDSGLFSAFVLAICIGSLVLKHKKSRDFWTIYGKSLSLAMISAIFASAIQFAAYWAWGKTLIPLTGLIKMAGILPSSNSSTVGRIMTIFGKGLPDNLFPRYTYPFLFITLLAIAIYYLRKLSSSSNKSLLICLLVLFAAGIGYSSYWLFSPSYSIGYWYFSPIKVTWIFGIAIEIYILLFTSSLRISKFFRRSLIGAACVIWILLVVHNYLYQLNYRPAEYSLYASRYRAALWMVENIPKDCLLASWNAGQLGFFSGHRVINLDGLVNDKQYYETVLKGRLSLATYLRRNNASYLIDYYDYTQDKFTEHLPILRSFPITDTLEGEPLSLHIWDLSALPKAADIGFYPKK